MKTVVLCAFPLVLIIIAATVLVSGTLPEFDRSAYYKVMEAGKIESIDQQIKIIETTGGINPDAYTGALLMRKAGMVKGLSKKLNTFKKGHNKLEAAIKTDNSNAEFRFLRLIIQETAPKMLGYHTDIDEDAKIIQSSFVNLSPEVKNAVLNYRKRSKALQELTF
jgi:hypothetical protein